MPKYEYFPPHNRFTSGLNINFDFGTRFNAFKPNGNDFRDSESIFAVFKICKSSSP